MPILVCHRTKFDKLGGRVSIPADAKFGKIRLGFGQVQIADNRYSRFIWSLKKNAQVSFGNRVKIGTGCRLYVSGKLSFGERCNFSGESSIVCAREITFGQGCLVSWNTLFMDTDFHPIMDENGSRLNENRSINIGNRVWVGAKATVMKGVALGDNSVVSAGAHVVSSYPAEVILGGNPAKEIGTMMNKYFSD
ncbi:2,3,4,5-tetrahydropyridine-2,6-dicarboxylate N-acetyltransferase [Vibrio stylophorae]|uniref:2,3,4,5-tetrahydropyridine-2,6-dicarboxylate N-acetyltransferase n=1 Tax=Vibrio stylophorae TaxID=659351 RepID=A0ABM8ZXD5_9VIBR|nr:acyltransferase [Vibrio stylophorae]CAH0534667.1 2,3,4,5-tetrahydropyridine-2,6-dicarboxylate N-acetyltransferase [Vibrio stylophorae]